MGLTKASMQKFMGRVDAAMRDLFPASLRISGTTYPAIGVGGSALNDYLAGGRAEQGQRFFRVEKTELATRPTVGTVVEWVDAIGPVTHYHIIEVPDRPHETSWMLRCEPRQR